MSLRQSSLSRTVPALIFVAGVAFSAWLATLAEQTAANVDRVRFERLVDRVHSEVSRRFRQYEFGLRGTRGLWAARDDVSPREFADMVASRDIAEEFPGALGIGFIRRVDRADLPAYQERVRAAGNPGFTVRTGGDNPEAYVIEMISPPLINADAFGFDVGSEQRRRTAADYAMLLGTAALSEPVTLVQASREGPGFLLFLPIYSRGSTLDTPLERRQALIGWAYMPLVASRVLGSIAAMMQDEVDFEIFHGSAIDGGTMVYDHDEHLRSGAASDDLYVGRQFVDRSVIPMAGGGWTVVTSTTDSFQRASRSAAWAAGLGGSALALLLALFVSNLGRTLDRAHVLAERMTSDLAQALEKNERLALFAQRTTNAVILADSERRIVWVNEGFTRITGYTLDEVSGKSPGTLLQCEETDPDTVARMREALHAGMPFRGEILNQGKDGHRYWLDIDIVPLHDAEGRLTGFMAVELDVTERKAAQRELEQRAAALAEARDAADAAAQAKADFLANMSHEIRTPMNAVIGMTELLGDTRLTPEQQECVSTIRKSGEALLAVISDILDFSKIESGKLEIEQVPFDLRECVETALDIVARTASTKGLDVLAWIEPDVPSRIVGDSTRLRQVLLNLLTNAVKFTARGEILVSICREGGDRLHVSVRDTGIGIPADRMDRLFKSFSQVDSSTTRHFGGTGLGLAICARLVELMGGKIWAESVFGKGSDFQFTLPLVTEGPMALSPRVDDGEFRGRRLLVVDDNATNRRILARQAESWGLGVTTVESGATALALVDAGNNYDLAVLDVQMPGMDGVELARELRRRPHSATLPLVALTSLGDSSRLTRAIPGLRVLTKPAKASMLFDAFREAFHARRRVCEELGGTPVTVPASGDTPAVDTSLAARLPMRILLAEDLPINQRVAQLLLGRLGYRCETVANGLEVLDAVARHPFDLILMDVQMPEMDGLEAANRLRDQLPPERRPWIVAMTANSLEGDREACLRAGMDDYVAKPLKGQFLAEALQRAAAGLAERRASGTRT